MCFTFVCLYFPAQLSMFYMETRYRYRFIIMAITMAIIISIYIIIIINTSFSSSSSSSSSLLSILLSTCHYDSTLSPKARCLRMSSFGCQNVAIIRRCTNLFWRWTPQSIFRWPFPPLSSLRSGALWNEKSEGPSCYQARESVWVLIQFGESLFCLFVLLLSWFSSFHASQRNPLVFSASIFLLDHSCFFQEPSSSLWDQCKNAGIQRHAYHWIILVKTK